MASNNCSKVTSKGQITVPLNIRKKLHLLTGSRVEFIIKDNMIIMLPINNSLSSLHGILPKPEKSLTIEEMNDIIQKKYDRN